MFQHVSNAGIILDIQGKKIGIDCLCKDSSGLYQDTIPEVREKLDLDILIFTHEHEDHFCAEYVKETWERNTNLQIYGGEMVIRALEKEKISLANLYGVGEGDVLKMDGLDCLFMESAHEGEQYSDVQNLTLLINMEDRKMVVTGDAMPCKGLFERISNWSPCIDWLFAPFPYVGLRSTRRVIQDHLDIKNIFALHLPREEADVQNWVANTKHVCEVVKDGLPQPVFPVKLGDWYCI